LISIATNFNLSFTALVNKADINKKYIRFNILSI